MPETGRFTGKDPFKGDGLNLYVYVKSNPMRFVDPRGYCAAEGQIGYAENPMLIIVIENFAGGVGNSVWDTLKGIGTMIIHPIQTGRNLKEALSHPIVTITSIGSLIKTSFVEQVIQGDAESRSRYAGKAAGEILMVVVSAKGAEKLAKAIKGLDKAEDVAKVLDTLDEPFKVIDDVDDVSKYFDDLVNSADEVLEGTSETVARYNPINKGPLPDAVAKTFRSSTYSKVVTQQETTLYRVYGGKAGEIGGYWTRTKPQGPLQAVIDSALDQNWGNTATEMSTIIVPKGTTIYEGAAAAQRGLVGGGNQIFIESVDPSWLVK
jgi:hypothetical protein